MGDNGASMSTIPELSSLENIELPHLLGRYLLQRLIGKGGTGLVFEAELQGPVGFRKQVALKLLKTPEGGPTEEQRQELLGEARLGGLLRHPNIVDTYELGEHEGRFFISLELIEGMSMHQILRQRGALPPLAALDVACQACAGLAHAHALTVQGQSVQFVHRDLKLGNMLVTRDGLVKLVDFGISSALGVVDARDETKIVGTPSYMSPEQVRCKPLDARSDLFSLGVVLYIMLTANRLFPGQSPAEVLHSVLSVDQLLAENNSMDLADYALPGSAAVLRRLLAANRSRRYGSAAELAIALDALRAGVGEGPGLREVLNSLLPGEQAHGTPWRQPVTGGWSGEQEPSVTVQHIKTNLGPAPDTFVGRTADIDELGHLIEQGTRLVTVKGTGGAGKTRVCRRFARSMVDALEGGVWFVDLTEAVSVLGVLRAAAAVLDVPMGGDDNLDGLVLRLGQAIEARGPILIVLDNFEQVVEHAPATVGRWLEQAPAATFLVTSREPLRLSAEVVFPIQPLPEDDGVTLFELRARAAGASWKGTKEADAAIHSIVKRLDGIPLAIELAAARSRMMSPQQILERLSQRFELLKGGRRGDTARQATLRGLIRWSWELLEPWEQSALAQVSVFRDGFFMEAAEAVVDLSAWPAAPWSLDVVGALLDKSLLHSREVLGQPRFEMYSSIQEYAAEKLAEAGDSGGESAMLRAQRRHAAWFAHRGAPDSSRSPDQAQSPTDLSEIFQELNNLVAATGYGTPDTAGQCGIEAIRIFRLKGPVSAGVNLAARVLAAPDLPRAMRIRLEIAQGQCLRVGGRMAEASAAMRAEADRNAEPSEEKELAILEAERLLELGHIECAKANAEEALKYHRAALDIYRKQRNRAGEGKTLNGLGLVYQGLGKNHEALEHFGLALEIHRETGARIDEGVVLGNLGIIYQFQCKYDEAIAHYQLAIEIHKERGNKHAEGHVLGSLGLSYSTQGEYDEAIVHFQLAIEIHKEIGDRRGAAISLGNLGIVYSNQGKHDEAIAYYRLAIENHREIGNKRGDAILHGNLGDALFRLGRIDEAQQAFEDAIATCDEIDFPPAAGAFRGSLALLVAKQGQFEQAHTLLAAGELQVEAYPDEHGKFLCKRARIEHLAGNPSAAAAAVDTAESIARAIKQAPDSELCRAIAELREILSVSPG